MAYFQGSERTAAVWEDLRQELAAFTISISEIPEWQGAFLACQEFHPESDSASPSPKVIDDSFVTASASTASKASAAASAETPALPAPALQAKKDATTGGSAEEATGEVPGKAFALESENTVSASSVASASAPAALAPSASAPSDPAAAAVTETSLGVTAEVPEKKEKDTGEKEKAQEGDNKMMEFNTFIDYVNSLPLDEFDKICSSHKEFLRSELEWLEKRRKRNSESKACDNLSENLSIINSIRKYQQMAKKSKMTA